MCGLGLVGLHMKGALSLGMNPFQCQEGPKMSKRQNKKICLIQPCGHCYDNVICFYLELPATFPGTLRAQKFLKILLNTVLGRGA